MRRLRRQGAHALLTVLTLELLAGCSTGRPAPGLTAAAPEPPPAVPVTLPRTALREDQQIIHVLNRLGYGPRPGDLERVSGRGSPLYRAPARSRHAIPDDRVEAALQAFPTLTMTVPELVRDYPEPDPKVLAKAPVRAR